MADPTSKSPLPALLIALLPNLVATVLILFLVMPIEVFSVFLMSNSIASICSARLFRRSLKLPRWLTILFAILFFCGNCFVSACVAKYFGSDYYFEHSHRG